MAKEVFTFFIGGDGGQGVQTAGRILSKSFMRSGLFAADTSEFASRIRGGLSTYQASVSGGRMLASHEKADVAVALTKEALSRVLRRMKTGGTVFFDSTYFKVEETQLAQRKDLKAIALPISSLVKEHALKPVMGNTLMISAVAAYLGIERGAIERVVGDVFASLQKGVVKENMEAIRTGYAVMERINAARSIALPVATEKQGKRILINGNDAAAVSAVASGVTLYVAYPMSPATSILHTLIGWSRKTGMEVRQVFDEIEAASVAMGASFAGARVLTGTSGGGFALMAESISGSAMAEVPMVVINSQRPGPATGLPTWTEQGDLGFAAHVGHGDFTRIVFAPGDVTEIALLVNKAFTVAEQFQTPVVVLLDKYLSDGHVVIDDLDEAQFLFERGKIAKDLKAGEVFARYRITDDGVSARIFPGQPGGVHVANTDEHDEKGYSIEGYDEDIRKAQVEKRLRKERGIIEAMPRPALYGNTSAKKTIVGWGSVKGPVLEAMDMALGGEYNFVHFTGMSPLTKEQVMAAVPLGNELVLVENNATGQFGKMLEGIAGISFKKKILKYDGSQFYPEEVAAELKIQD
jgi:2-oxoglutarate ferredoxin oxidoreductase subunit alpha